MTLDPIAIATAGYVCDGCPNDISIAHQGYVCIAAVVDEEKNRPYLWRGQDRNRRQILREDEEIFAIIVAFVELQEWH